MSFNIVLCKCIYLHDWPWRQHDIKSVTKYVLPLSCYLFAWWRSDEVLHGKSNKGLGPWSSVQILCFIKSTFLCLPKYRIVSVNGYPMCLFCVCKPLEYLHSFHHNPCTLYGEGSILSPKRTWPKFSDGRFIVFSEQKSNLHKKEETVQSTLNCAIPVFSITHCIQLLGIWA